MQVSDVAQMSLVFSDIQMKYESPGMNGMYSGLSVFTLDFLPNTVTLLESLTGYSANGTNGTNTTELRNGTRLLDDSNQKVTVDSPELHRVLFLVNVGGVISFYLVVLIVYPIIVLLSWRVAFLMKVRGYFEWSGFFATALFHMYKVLHSACVQLQYVLLILAFY